METLEDKIRRVTAEEVQVVAYDPMWPLRFEQERQHLLECMPSGMIVRIEHFGGTAVVGLAAKPIVDMVVEVRDTLESKAAGPGLLHLLGRTPASHADGPRAASEVIPIGQLLDTPVCLDDVLDGTPVTIKSM